MRSLHLIPAFLNLFTLVCRIHSSNNNNNKTYQLGSPSLTSNRQTKNKTGHNSISPSPRPHWMGQYIFTDIYSPRLVTNCCPGNGLNHVHIMECLSGQKTFPFLRVLRSSLLCLTQLGADSLSPKMIELTLWNPWNGFYVSGNPSLKVIINNY